MIHSTISGRPGSLLSRILNELNEALKRERAAKEAPKTAPKDGGVSSAPVGEAVRFDLSAPPQGVVPAAPVAAPVVNAVAAPVAASLVQPVAQAAPTPAPAAPAPAAPAPAAVATVIGARAPAVARGTAVMAPPGAVPATAGTAAPLYKAAAALDEEAMARAMALRAIARESALGMIDRIARLTDRPEQAEAATATSRDATPATGEPAERKTLALL